MRRLLLLALLALSVGRVGAAQQADTLARAGGAEALFVRALTEAYLEDHEQAAALLHRVLERRPNEPAVLAALAESYDALGQPTVALSYAAQAVEHAPEEPAYLALLARIQTEGAAPEAAVTTYERLVAVDPTPEALAELGRLYEQAGRYADALATYERLLAVGGEDAALRLRMEALHRRLGDADAGLRMLEAAAEAFPEERTILFRLGLAYREAGRPADAVGVWERLVAAYPGDAEAVLLLADAYEAAGEEERAAELRAGRPATSPQERLRRAALLYAQIESDPNAADEARRLLEPFADDPEAPAEALVMLGALLYDARAYARAADVLDRALAADPRHLEAWKQAAGAALYAGDPERALATVEEALVLFPGQVPLLRIKGHALAKLERPREAIAAVEEAAGILAEEEPENGRARAHLLSLVALLREELGEHAAADAAFDEALALDPDNALVLNNYAYTLAEREARLDDALAMAKRAVAAAPDNAYFLDTLGWVLYRLRRYDEAADALERAVAADDRFALLYEHLGDIYAARGDRAAARTAWQRALDLNPQNEALRQKLAGQ